MPRAASGRGNLPSLAAIEQFPVRRAIAVPHGVPEAVHCHRDTVGESFSVASGCVPNASSAFVQAGKNIGVCSPIRQHSCQMPNSSATCLHVMHGRSQTVRSCPPEGYPGSLQDTLCGYPRRSGGYEEPARHQSEGLTIAIGAGPIHLFGYRTRPSRPCIFLRRGRSAHEPQSASPAPRWLLRYGNVSLASCPVSSCAKL